MLLDWPNPENRHENAICGGACFAGGLRNRRRRRSRPPCRGKPPAYVVTEIDITDLDAYQKQYAPLTQASIRSSGGRLMAATQNIVVLEGSSPGVRVAVNQFDSLEAIQAWRDTAQYKDARKIGDKYAKFRAFAIEGLPQ